MFTYKCRAECIQDIGHIMISFVDTRRDGEYISGHLITNIGLTDKQGNIVKDIDGNEIYYPAFDWIFKSNMDIDDVLYHIDKCPESDLHVIYESLNYIAEYTGERFRS
jgi:hypothetical protein